MTEKACIQKIKDALTLAKQARVGCELTYFDVIELYGYITGLEQYIRELEAEIYRLNRLARANRKAQARLDKIDGVTRG